MGQIPANYILDGIRGLRGKARVTYPGASLDVLKVERILTVSRKEWQLPYYTPDVEHETAILIEQHKLSENNQMVEVYRAYHTLPGVLISGTETEPETNEQLTVTRQIMREDAPLPPNGGGMIYEKQPIDDVICIHITRDYTSLLGKAWDSFPNISYTFPGLLTMRSSTLSERSQPASYRPPRSLIVRARVEVSFSVEPADDEVFNWLGVNLRSDGGNYSDVLHDLRDVVLGGRRQRVEASYPTAREYPIGEEILIRAPSERTSYGLYRTERTFVTAL